MPRSPGRDEQSPKPLDSSNHSIPLQTFGLDEYDENNLQAGAFRTESAPYRDRVVGPVPTDAQMAANLPSLSTYWDQPYAPQPDDGVSPESPIDPAALQFALPPDISHYSPGIPQVVMSMDDPYGMEPPYFDEPAIRSFPDGDQEPLASQAQPISGTLYTPNAEAEPRNSFQTVSDLDNSPSRFRDGRTLGLDLESGHRSASHRSYGDTLMPSDNRRSRSPSTSGALYRAGSIVRAMSQRVVMIGGEGELVDQKVQRHRSRSPSAADQKESPRASAQMLIDTSYQSQVFQIPAEKNGEPEVVFLEPPRHPMPQRQMQNPLKGNSLGLFSPTNPVRTRLCDLLVNPWTEPLILILIVLQAVLLAVEAAPNVFISGRPESWGGTPIDWAMFGLFVVFTLEIIVRIIVSGFILNAPEYSSIDRSRGVRAAVVEQYRAIFQPQRQKSVKGTRPVNLGPSPFTRSFTIVQGQTLPQTVEEQQRFQLARRAFLRHGFNRLDFVAVASFWISFVLSITGLESHLHLYLFRMLSCLRILRLLSLTNGTAVSNYLSFC